MAGSIHIKLDSTAARSIDDYLEYRRIVGDDDGGVLFSPEQYEAYKRKVIPMRMKNRLFVSWESPNGIECKMVGPETMCFCQHRYKQHKTDFEEIPSTKPIKVPCKIIGCGCKSFEYVPLNGSRPIRCQCKHFTDDHSVLKPHKCTKGCGCTKFHSSFTCGCGEPTYAHKMIVETKDERQSRGRPVGYDVPYQAMGGLTGFSSLADGYMRLDDSGIGPPSDEVLKKPITSSDHPFLRMYADLEKLSVEDNKVAGPLVPRRTTEEEDMAYFEKRYQERLKAEREAARLQSRTRAVGRGQRAVPDRGHRSTQSSHSAQVKGAQNKPRGKATSRE